MSSSCVTQRTQWTETRSWFLLSSMDNY
jgi:hypothetical protein